MANSGTVTAGSAALASQYNNLRLDVLDVSTGHTHAGTTNEGAKVAATGVSSGTAANGAVLTADGSGAAAFLAAGASGGILKYQEFTSSGSFIIPASASSSALVILEVLGAGAGGEGGNNRGSGTIAYSTGGGNGGPYGVFQYSLATFGSAGGTVTVTIGAGGAGGSATSATGGNGGSSGAGGLTSFGSQEFIGASNFAKLVEYYTDPFRFQNVSNLYPSSGAGTAAGTAQALNGVGANNESLRGGAGAAYGWDAAKAGLSSDFTGAGGGGGGPVTGANVAGAGGASGKRYGSPLGHMRNLPTANSASIVFGDGASGGTLSGGAGGTASNSGGGGGAAHASGNGGAGGAGDIGCGGGGGGGCRTGFTSGVGGAGGGARVKVWVIG